MNNELLTVSQTASYLKLSEKTVRRLISDKKLQASKLSDRSWRVRACDIEAYVENNFNMVDIDYADEGKKSTTVHAVAESTTLFPEAVRKCSAADLSFFGLWWS